MYLDRNKDGHAVISENPNDIDLMVTGPLVAGIIPWGHGMYEHEILMSDEVSGMEHESSKNLLLTITKKEKLKMELILDPQKEFCVISCTFSDLGGKSKIVQAYEGYELISGQWIPSSISIERYLLTAETKKLVSYEDWQFLAIETEKPRMDEFAIPFQRGTMIKHKTSDVEGDFWYNYTEDLAIDSILQERQSISGANDERLRNCALVTIDYIANQFSVDISTQALFPLIDRDTDKVSLNNMQLFIGEIGLNALAVQTNLKTLKDLNCHAILHIPSVGHYVVLHDIDEEYVWTIDLTSDQFLRRTTIANFDALWSKGIALLVSDKELPIAPEFKELTDEQTSQIFGSDEGFSSYDCTGTVQEHSITQCPPPTGLLCADCYYEFALINGCAESQQTTTCTGTGVSKGYYSPCVNDPYDTSKCKMSVQYWYRSIRGCIQND